MAQPHDELEVYNTVCKERFTVLEKNSYEMIRIVSNGLNEKVQWLCRAGWGIIMLLIATLATTVFSMLTRGG